MKQVDFVFGMIFRALNLLTFSDTTDTMSSFQFTAANANLHGNDICKNKYYIFKI